MKIHANTLLWAAVAAMALLCGGCPEPKVFDKAAINQLRSVVVMPLSAPNQSSAGPLASGRLAQRLRTPRYKNLEILVPPALWRLRHSSGRPPNQLLTRQDALAVAREMNADAVLTGTAGYAIARTFPSDLPAGISALKNPELRDKFAVRSAGVSVILRLVSVRQNRDLYVYHGKAAGADDTQLLTVAIDKAVKPLEQHLAKR